MSHIKTIHWWSSVGYSSLNELQFLKCLSKGQPLAFETGQLFTV